MVTWKFQRLKGERQHHRCHQVPRTKILSRRSNKNIWIPQDLLRIKRNLELKLLMQNRILCIVNLATMCVRRAKPACTPHGDFYSTCNMCTASRSTSRRCPSSNPASKTTPRRVLPLRAQAARPLARHSHHLHCAITPYYHLQTCTHLLELVVYLECHYQAAYHHWLIHQFLLRLCSQGQITTITDLEWNS